MYRHCHLVTLFFGTAILVAGMVAVYYVVPRFQFLYFDEVQSLKNGPGGLERWKTPRWTMNFKVYFFDVTNPEAVRAGKTAKLVEKGPYIYDLTLKRVPTKFDEATDSMEYTRQRDFKFNQHASGDLRDTDTFTIINVPLLGFLENIRSSKYGLDGSDMSIITDKITEWFPSFSKGPGYPLFITVPVRDILFGKNYKILVENKYRKYAQTKLAKAMESNPEALTFSIFGQMNNTIMGIFNITRGLTSALRGNILEVNHKRVLTKYDDSKGKFCNMINGSDFYIFRVFKDIPEHLYTYIEYLGRSMRFAYEGERKLKEFTLLKYILPRDLLVENKYTRCFCNVVVEEGHGGYSHMYCYPTGTQSLKAHTNMNIILSYPHFYLFEKQVQTGVDGMQPNRSLHETFALLEPNTGLPMRKSMRFQYNMKLVPWEKVSFLENVTEAIFPFVWFEENFMQADKVYGYLDDVIGYMRILHISKYVTVAIGILVMLSSVFVLLYYENMLCCDALHDIVKPKNYKNLEKPEIYPNLYPQENNRNVYDGLDKDRLKKIEDSDVFDTRFY